MRNIFILATKRSTHHAFIESIVKAQPNTVYYNHCSVDDNTLNHIIETPGEKPYQTKIYSFEKDYDPQHVVSFLTETYDNPTIIILLRDPLNTLASTYSAHETGRYGGILESNMKLYKELFDYIQTNTNDSDVEFVYANDFWANSNYRKSIEDKLNIKFLTFNDLSRFGKGGGTFFKDQNNNITANKINSRYKIYECNDEFQQYVEREKQLIDSFNECQKRW